MANSVYVTIYQGGAATAVILGVFDKLVDANDECLHRAAQLGVTLSGEKQAQLREAELMRWDNPEGLSCWVEAHLVRDNCVFTVHRNNDQETSIDCSAWIQDT